MRRWLLVIVLSGIFILTQCKNKPDGVFIPDEPYQTLSEYQFFEGALANLEPAEGVLPYDLNSPLFSDYARKARFVWMPEGTSASYTTEHVLDFPVDAVLIKNFYYNNDERDIAKGRKIIETRILVNRGEEWDAYGYIWNDEQTEANFEIIGDIKDVSWIDEEGQEQRVEYIIPNKNQCKGCHAYKNKQLPIGPKVRNLNKDYVYDSGSMNQLEKWVSTGILTGMDQVSVAPSVASYDHPDVYGLNDRAMAYLDINCGHCHNPDGAANTSGLMLLADSEMGLPLGIYKATVSAGAGTGGFTYSIVPGNPEESIMIYRMNSDNPGAMMPELGRRLIHDEGVELISDWIAAMDPELYDSPETQSAQ